MLKSKFSVELRNRFLMLEVEKKYQRGLHKNANVYTETAENVYGSSEEEKQ